MSLNAWKERGRTVLDPLVTLLVYLHVTPTAITLAGLLIHVWSAIWIGMGRPFAGGILLLVASVCDALDGGVARRTQRVTRFGAFLDSSVDRIDETLVLAGIAAFFLSTGGDMWAVLAVLALGGSLITSYTRARAEGLGLECKVGVFERPERVVVTIAGLLFGRTVLMGALVVLAVLSWITVYQRIRHVQHVLERPEPPEGPPAV